MTELWDHQTAEVHQHTHAPARGLLWDPRVGKTRTVVNELKTMDFDRILIVAPIMALKMTWRKELAVLDREVYDLSVGLLTDRADVIRSFKKDERAILLINYEALATLEDDLIRWQPEAIIVDEAHLIKSASAQRTRVLTTLGKKSLWRRILTGTPTPKNYIDLYAQFKFLDPSVFGTSKARFVERYCYMHPRFSTVLGYKNLPELEMKMNSRTTRVTRGQCFDIPEVQEIEREVVLPPKARASYDQLCKTFRLELEGMPDVDASHKLTRLVKLQKLTSGFVAEENEVRWLHNEKIHAVIEELAEPLEARQHVVVSYHFTHEGAELEHAIRTTYERSGVMVERLSGATAQRDRERITSPFDLSACGSDDTPRVLIVQEQVGGLGISLARANLCIFTSCSMNGAAHSQMRDRIWSPGGQITYVYIRCPKTVDQFVRNVLLTKENAQRALLDVGFLTAAYGGYAE